MFETIAKLQVPYIMMHMQGTPENMQAAPFYSNVAEEIISFFSAKLAKLKEFGIHDVIIDPGFGFGKTLTHNYELLKSLEQFQIFGLPLLVGLSRKSMIYRFLDIKPEEALNGTTVLNTMALIKGADMIRVHDVAQARQALEIYRKLIDPSYQRV
jgi:dihydropteroate synthase